MQNLVFFFQGVDNFKAKVDIEVSKASIKAIKAIESVGGSVTTAYYNPVSLRAHLCPEKYEDNLLNVPRRALPKKKMIKYYLNPENRGYLLTPDGQKRLKVLLKLYISLQKIMKRLFSSILLLNSTQEIVL